MPLTLMVNDGIATHLRQKLEIYTRDEIEQRKAWLMTLQIRSELKKQIMGELLSVVLSSLA
jgi:hypothetical protein